MKPKPLAAAIGILDGDYVKQWGRIMVAFLIASVPLIITLVAVGDRGCIVQSEREDGESNTRTHSENLVSPFDLHSSFVAP